MLVRRARLIGWIMLGLVVGAIVIVPRATAPFAGRPVRTPIPPPPAVGWCLTQPLSLPLTDAVLPVPSAALGRCAADAVRLGEVTAVVADHTNTSIEDAELGCQHSSDDYLGATIDAAGSGWHAAGLYTSALLGPSATDRLLGAAWLACLVAPEPSADSVTTTSYGRSARHSFAGGAPPAAFAWCVSSLDGDESGQVVPCAATHSAEMFAVNADGTARSQDCPAVIRRLTGMPDPTAQGQLEIRVVTAPPNPSQVCGLTTRRTLTGALLDLGSAPIPFG